MYNFKDERTHRTVADKCVFWQFGSVEHAFHNSNLRAGVDCQQFQVALTIFGQRERWTKRVRVAGCIDFDVMHRSKAVNTMIFVEPDRSVGHLNHQNEFVVGEMRKTTLNDWSASFQRLHRLKSAR